MSAIEYTNEWRLAARNELLAAYAEVVKAFSEEYPGLVTDYQKLRWDGRHGGYGLTVAGVQPAKCTLDLLQAGAKSLAGLRAALEEAKVGLVERQNDAVLAVLEAAGPSKPASRPETFADWVPQ